MDKIIKIRAGGIAYKDGKLIIARHHKEGKTYYVLPGGGLENEESPQQALEREFIEETGFKVKVGRLAYYKILYNDEYYSLDMIYECEIVGGKLEINDPDGKVEEVKFVDKEELDELVFYPEQLKEHLFKPGKEAVFLGIYRFPED
ncbi:hypothetical protein CO038_03235 [Candidatus Pacearchaeota archaeon CG_4_9_14_0_2_um_filter_39_13]|nr:NUDIX hydrolase [Candidatus Pacearchaeota archaeon]OIO42662.1 MAG: hypothetical protein AUJ64_03770 [Candidatus Pacearchaeota archaeon CG1_02_39_14]PJC44579.1 MAG: hypothetical protein CO038_03235 [Candidatus Pacearchaeota archaeon CG_4_9_14_0_2_um_filter_39_13]